MTVSIAARRISVIASLAIGLLVGPAHARADAPVANEQSAEAVPSSREEKVKLGAATKYCMVEEGTGSRIPKKVCRTKQQWSDQGVEIPSR